MSRRQIPDWLQITLLILVLLVVNALLVPVYGWLLAIGWGWAQ